MSEDLFDILTKWQIQSERSFEYVFPSKNGPRLDNIKKSWVGLRKRANLQNIRFKDLRSEFGPEAAGLTEFILPKEIPIDAVPTLDQLTGDLGA